MSNHRSGAVTARRHRAGGAADQPVDEPVDRPAGAPLDPPPTAPQTPPGLLFAVRSGLALRVGVGLSVTFALLGLVSRLLWHGRSSGIGAGLFTLLDVDGEGSIPAWFSTLLLAACAAALWTVAALVRRAGERRSWPWVLLAVVFVYLSLDEAVSLHEEATEPLRDALGTTGVLHYSWILVAVPAGIVLLVGLVPFLRTLPRPTLVAFLVAGGVYVAGAVGMEMVGGILGSRAEQGTTVWHFVVATEELLEMLGAALFLAAVSRHRERYVDAPPAGEDVRVGR